MKKALLILLTTTLSVNGFSQTGPPAQSIPYRVVTGTWAATNEGVKSNMFTLHCYKTITNLWVVDSTLSTQFAEQLFTLDTPEIYAPLTCASFDNCASFEMATNAMTQAILPWYTKTQWNGSTNEDGDLTITYYYIDYPEINVFLPNQSTSNLHWANTTLTNTTLTIHVYKYDFSLGTVGVAGVPVRVYLTGYQN